MSGRRAGAGPVRLGLLSLAFVGMGVVGYLSITHASLPLLVLVAVAGLATIFWASPKVGLCVVLFLIPFSNFTVDLGILVEPFHLSLALLLVMFVLKQMFLRKSLRLLPADKILVVYLAVASVLTLTMSAVYYLGDFSEFHGGILRTALFRPAIQIIKLAGIAAGYVLAVNILDDGRSVRAAIKTVLASAIIVCLYGIYQFLGGHYDLPFIIGLNDPTIGTFREDPILYAGATRVSSFSLEPKHLGAFLTPLIVMCLYLTHCDLDRQIARGKASLVASTLLFTFTLILTFARSSWVLLLLALVAVPVLTRVMVGGRWSTIGLIGKPLLIIGAVVIFASSVMEFAGYGGVNILIQRLESINDIYTIESNLDRTRFEVAMEVVGEHPILGVGMGNFAYYYVSLMPGAIQRVEAVPNWFLATLVDTGVVGFIVLAAFLVGSLRFVGRSLRVGASPLDGVVISLAATVLTMLVLSFYFSGPTAAFFLFLGLTKAGAAVASEERWA